MRRLLALSLCLLIGCGDADEDEPLRLYVADGDGGTAANGEEGGGAGMGDGVGGSDGLGGSDGAGGSDGTGGADGTGGSNGTGGGGSNGPGGFQAGGGGGASGSTGKGGSLSSGAGGVAGQGGSGAQAGKGGTGGKGGASGTGGKGGASGTGGKGGASGTGGTGGKGGGAAGTAGAGGGTTGACPDGMAFVEEGSFCIDRWEAQVEVQVGGAWTLHSPYETLDDVDAPIRAITSEGVPPQGYISGVQSKEACVGAGKRLCTYDEHLVACSGPEDLTWPYGDTRIPGKCNEGRTQHPVIEMFGPGATFNNTELNDPGLNQLPDSLAETGARTECVSAYGAYDLAGNLHEWVDDPNGSFVGGFYVDAVKNFPGCLYKTTAHAFGYHDYSTGFRCCASPL